MVFFPNRHCAEPFSPVVCGVGEPSHAYYGQGEKRHIAIIAQDLAVAESVPASIRFEVNLRYIYIFTPFTCLR